MQEPIPQPRWSLAQFCNGSQPESPCLLPLSLYGRAQWGLKCQSSVDPLFDLFPNGSTEYLERMRCGSDYLCISLRRRKVFLGDVLPLQQDPFRNIDAELGLRSISLLMPSSANLYLA